MRSRKRILSGIVGVTILGISSGAIAATYVHPPRTQSTVLSESPLQPTGIIQTDWSDHHEWGHHHHPPDYNVNPNDYNWGGRYRYQYPPGWLSGPPSRWAVKQQRAYLEQRREVAINMQQQMVARGDMNAAQRLGGVISQLNRELGYR